MSEWKAKRFWKAASVVASGEGFEVLLDGRPVRTPAKASLLLPSRALADAIAHEWDAQEDEIAPLTMPHTRSANAAIDRVAPEREAVAEIVAAYGETDLLCYRADAPDALVSRQSTSWDPFLAWCTETLGATLTVHTGLMPGAQDPSAMQRLRACLGEFDDFELTAVHDLVALSGSLVLGLATASGFRSAEDVWTASRLDEIWQQEQWGVDEDAESDAMKKRDSFLHAKAFLDAVRAN